MSENSPADKPARRPPGDAATEAEIDELLASAARLAQDLEHELGTDRPIRREQSGRPRAAANVAGSADAPADEPPVDAQFDKIDTLLDQASAELGPDLGQAPPTDKPSDAEGAELDNASAAATSEPAVKTSASAPPGTTARQGVADPVDLTDLESLPDLDALPDLDPAAASKATQVVADAAPRDATLLPSPWIWRCVHRGLDGLDLFDRLFHWLGQPAKAIIGWLALATLLAAACLAAYPHLR